jgi:uncharacterized cupredoxin-like copper-binding protein
VQRALHRPAAVLVAALSILAAGCAAKDDEQLSGARVVRVTQRDFRINAPKQIPAGEVVLAVDNQGPDDHELLVVREEEGHKSGEEGGEEETPLGKDGLTVDQEGLGPAVVDGLEPGAPGVRHLRVKLKPGRYEFLCNMAGHYLGGMERDVKVQ